jgi:adenylate cyclase
VGVEIERKFLVRGDAWMALGEPVLMRQGYLSSHKDRVVRVRIEGERAVMTIKGRKTSAPRAANGNIRSRWPMRPSCWTACASSR